MSNVKALRVYSERNPGLQLVVNAVPGNRNFPHTIARLISLASLVAITVGAWQLMGGDKAQLWQVKPFVAVLALAFVLSSRTVGFRTTFTGFIASIFGAPAKDQLHEFNEEIAATTWKAGHLFALMTILQAMPRMTDATQIVRNLAPACIGYIYVAVLAFVLPQRKEKTDKVHFMDIVMPAVLLGCAYYAFNHIK